MEEQGADLFPFVIQVDDRVSVGQVRPEMSVAPFVEATRERLEAVGRVVADAVDPFFCQLASLPTSPAECSIEFGVSVGGEAGVPLVTKGTLSANFKVSLKWTWGARK